MASFSDLKRFVGEAGVGTARGCSSCQQSWGVGERRGEVNEDDGRVDKLRDT